DVDRIEAAGFDRFEAVGGFSTQGPVTLSLGESFVVRGDNIPGNLGTILVRPTGDVLISAPYIRFSTDLQQTFNFQQPLRPGDPIFDVRFEADNIDLRGAFSLQRNVNASFVAQNDLRLIGVQDTRLTLGTDAPNFPARTILVGQLSAFGKLQLDAGQIYPTTSSTYILRVEESGGLLSFGRTGTTVPQTPLSAGGAIFAFADQIDQGGVLKAPLGRIQLGSATEEFTIDEGFASPVDGTQDTQDRLLAFVTPTRLVSLLPGSITSTAALDSSGAALTIPYGETTDLREYFFSPTNPNPLAAPPAASVTLSGAELDAQPGSTIDVRGGGDLYAYEFVSGVFGSRDVLDRFNSDPFSSRNGFQYPDGRQVYAILPSRRADALAVFDPIYSRDYQSTAGGALYDANAGRRVFLEPAPGFEGGWYTLLPARYATQPGALRLVEQLGQPA
ncbi:MAG: hypothetical protein ACRC1J_09290, partial [Sandaracinobacteroides sp.]